MMYLLLGSENTIFTRLSDRMMNRILLIVQPENQQHRQVDFLTSFLEEINSLTEEIVLLVGEDIKSTAIFEGELPEKFLERIKYKPIPSLNNTPNESTIFEIQNNDHFLISGTKLQLACFLSELKLESEGSDIVAVCVHETPDQSSFVFHKYTCINSNIQVDYKAIERKRIIPASRLLSAKSYTFDVVNTGASRLSNKQKKLLLSEQHDPRKRSADTKAQEGRDFEAVLAHLISQHPRVIETLMNCEMSSDKNKTAREEDIVCTMENGDYLFISCKFGKSGTLKELKRLANATISRNLQPRERWKVVFATRHSKLEIAEQHIAEKGFNVRAVSLLNIEAFLTQLNENIENT